MAVLLAGLGLMSTIDRTAAQLAPIGVDDALISKPRTLRLEVFINGLSTGFIESFRLTLPERFEIRRGDLEEAGIKTTGHGSPRDALVLSDICAGAYRYDEARQRMDFTLSDEQRLPRVFDMSGRTAKAPSSKVAWGALANYDLFAAGAGAFDTSPRFSGSNTTLNTRAFGPYGEIDQTTIIGKNATSGRDALRLETFYTYADPDWTTTTRVGDSISGGLAWTRPIRFAGVQVARDFTLRPDIVTAPLPTVSGSAALPSTVDVFVGGIKAVTQDVGTGPYSLINLPIMAGNGTARTLVTDATGRQTEANLPIFATSTLLAPGLSQFSVEAGFARRAFGLASSQYDPAPLASASGRLGMADWLTAEAHAEAGGGLLGAGAGAVTRIGPWGTLTTAASFSHRSSRNGLQFYGGYEQQVGVFTIECATFRTWQNFDDLGSIDAGATRGSGALGLIAANAIPVSLSPPRALDQLSVGFPAPVGNATITLGLINAAETIGQRSSIVDLSVSAQLPRNISVYASAFADLGTRAGTGLFAGLSVPIGDRVQASLGASRGGIDTEATQTLQRQDGSVGWRVRDQTGEASFKSVEGSYRSAVATGDVGVTQQRSSLNAQASLDGSIGFVTGGGSFLGNRIDDSFAIVDAGAAHVPVLQDNRPVGETNPWGKYVVTDLRSYGRNQIAIDPDRLPPDAEAASTRQVVVPARGAGVALDFGVDTHVQGASVVFKDGTGRAIPAGSKGHLIGTDETFVVGYDGQAYVRHLGASNEVVIDRGDVDCRASFDYRPDAGRIRLGPVSCL